MTETVPLVRRLPVAAGPAPAPEEDALPRDLGLKPPGGVPRAADPPARRALALGLATAFGLLGLREKDAPHSAAGVLAYPQPRGVVRGREGVCGVVARVWAAHELLGAPGRVDPVRWARFVGSFAVTLNPVARRPVQALEAAQRLADYVRPAAASDLFVGYLDGYTWLLAVRPGLRGQTDPDGFVFAGGERLKARLNAGGLVSLLNRIWVDQDIPRVFRAAGGARFGTYGASLRFVHPLSATALLNAAALAANPLSPGNVAVLNPVAVADLFAGCAPASGLTKLISRTEAMRAAASGAD